MRTFESAARSDKRREPQREVRPDEAVERVDPGARAAGGQVRPTPGPPGPGSPGDGSPGAGAESPNGASARAPFSFAQIPIAPGQKAVEDETDASNTDSDSDSDSDSDYVNDSRRARVIADMSRAFGLDFSKVRIRTDAEAARIAETQGTLALTDGREILFARHAFDPGTPRGDRIIAHEFAHVAQAQGGTRADARVRVRGRALAGSLGRLHFGGKKAAASGSGLADLEEEADRAADLILSGALPNITAATLGPHGARLPPGGEAKTDQSKDYVKRPPAGLWARASDGTQFAYIFNPVDLQGRDQGEIAQWVFEIYASQIFGAQKDLADKAARAQHVAFAEPLDLAKARPDEAAVIFIRPELHEGSVAFFAAIGIQPKIDLAKVTVGNVSDLKDGGDGDGDAEVSDQAQQPGADKPKDKAQESPELAKARALLELLRNKYPQMFTAMKSEVTSELDLLKFIAQNPTLFENLPPIPIGGTPTEDLSKFKDFLEKWQNAQQTEQGTGNSPGQGGGNNPDAAPVKMLHPDGSLRIDPSLDSAKGDKFIEGSSVDARIEWKGEALGWMDAFPNWGQFDWRLVDKANNSPVDTPHFGVQWGKDTWNVDIPERSGTFNLVVTVMSEHFYDGQFTPKPILMTTATEEARDKEIFDTSFTDPKTGPFDRGPDGKLHMREGQKALSLNDEITSLDAQIGAIHALEAKGRLSEEDARNYAKYYENEKKSLEELKTKTDKGQATYFVRASFVSRENSAAIPQMRVYMVQLKDASDPEGGSVDYEVVLYDTTLDQENYTQHPGEGSAEIKEGEKVQAHQQAEIEAVQNMAAHFHKHNDYPKGTVHFAVKYLLSDGVFEDTANTNNWKKPAQAVLGYVGMAAGVALILASPLDFGTTAVAGIALIGAASGLISVGIALEEQYAKEGRIKIDSRLALNLVTIVTSIVGLSEIGGAFAAVKTVSRGMSLAKVGFNLGAAGIQTVLLADSVNNELKGLAATYGLRLAQMEKGTPEYQALEREYESKIGQLIGGAAVNGTFILVAFGQGVHGLSEIPAPGMMSGAKTQYMVHEDIIDLAFQFDKTGDPRLIEERLSSGVVTPDEKAYLQEALGKIPAKEPADLPANPDPLKSAKVPPPSKAAAAAAGAGETAQKAGPPGAPTSKTATPDTVKTPAPPDTPPGAQAAPKDAAGAPSDKGAPDAAPTGKVAAPPSDANANAGAGAAAPEAAAPAAKGAVDSPAPAGPDSPGEHSAAADKAAELAKDTAKSAEKAPPVDKAADAESAGKGEAAKDTKTSDPEKTGATDQAAPELAAAEQKAAEPAETPKQKLARQTKAAKEAYKAAKKSGYKSETYDSQKDFIKRYTDPENPKFFDLETRHWVNEATEGKPSEKMASTKGLSPEARENALDAAMDKFTGPDSESSFKQYYEMLTEGDTPIADDAEVQHELQKILDEIPAGKEHTVDTVRHKLKTRFRDKVINRMFSDAQGKILTPEESHTAMRELTKNLNSADKGNITEAWIDGYRSLDPANAKNQAAQHVKVGKGEHPKLGLASDRVLDRVEFGKDNVGTINEIKSGEGPMNKHDLEQHADNMKLIDKTGTSLAIDGDSVTVQKAKLTYASPEGAAANADWIVSELTNSNNLSVEVFNDQHQSMVFDNKNMGEGGAALKKFLGKTE